MLIQQKRHSTYPWRNLFVKRWSSVKQKPIICSTGEIRIFDIVILFPIWWIPITSKEASSTSLVACQRLWALICVSTETAVSSCSHPHHMNKLVDPSLLATMSTWLPKTISRARHMIVANYHMHLTRWLLPYNSQRRQLNSRVRISTLLLLLPIA